MCGTSEISSASYWLDSRLHNKVRVLVPPFDRPISSALGPGRCIMPRPHPAVTPSKKFNPTPKPLVYLHALVTHLHQSGTGSA
jgi:hypothetical protein